MRVARVLGLVSSVLLIVGGITIAVIGRSEPEYLVEGLLFLAVGILGFIVRVTTLRRRRRRGSE